MHTPKKTVAPTGVACSAMVRCHGRHRLSFISPWNSPHLGHVYERVIVPSLLSKIITSPSAVHLQICQPISLAKRIRARLPSRLNKIISHATRQDRNAAAVDSEDNGSTISAFTDSLSPTTPAITLNPSVTVDATVVSNRVAIGVVRDT